MQELLKDKLQQWLSSKSMGESDQPDCSLSKKERGIVHMIAGLGFEWALNPILSHGVNVNFWDINGWTALHWASRFGRTPAIIAASNGHKGLAGYLSEVSLTSHLSSLTLEESELSKGSAESGMQLRLLHLCSLHSVHSFRRRQQKDAAGADSSIDQYGLDSDDIPVLLAMSKLTFCNVRDYNSAAFSIQKKYRGWKDKVILRWRRKGVGLRGFRQETESSIDDSEDEDILKVFRKEKVDGAIDEAVSRVLGMVDFPDAHQQYHRMLERYRQAKDELGATAAAASISGGDIVDMDNDDSYLLE
ncbi:hypothetical protein QYF36_013098 [Acer negundo]|nr:hypothetical protein QYF36_013098 [Acer negundo]